MVAMIQRSPRLGALPARAGCLCRPSRRGWGADRGRYRFQPRYGIWSG